jgi:poly-gamma-glutamate capsule biosynthesis protein CapA/YwtB (metallophosphatase superfamily)
MSKNPSILITGDFCPVNRTSDQVSDGKFELLFNDFLPYIKNAGLAITNLECPLTEKESKIDKSGPLLKASVKSAEALSYSGFKLVTLANNHIMDYGFPGMTSTVNVCERNGIDYVGIGVNFTEARAAYYTKLGNYDVAILNIAENEFSTTHGNYPGSNPLDTIENYYDIVKAKAKAEYVIVIVHSGHEMYNLPSLRTKNTFHFYADAGASAIIAHHAHCYSGYEIYNGVPIFYGLGNFIFDKPAMRNSSWNFGFAVELLFEGKVTFNIVPYEQNGSNVGVRLLEDTKTREFFNNIERLNSIIINDDLLDAEFEQYCARVRKKYYSFLEPHSIRLIHFLQNRKLFPSLLSKRKKTLYLNLIRCESHREVLLHLLNTREHFEGERD